MFVVMCNLATADLLFVRNEMAHAAEARKQPVVQSISYQHFDLVAFSMTRGGFMSKTSRFLIDHLQASPKGLNFKQGQRERVERKRFKNIVFT